MHRVECLLQVMRERGSLAFKNLIYKLFLLHSQIVSLVVHILLVILKIVTHFILIRRLIMHQWRRRWMLHDLWWLAHLLLFNVCGGANAAPCCHFLLYFTDKVLLRWYVIIDSKRSNPLIYVR